MILLVGARSAETGGSLYLDAGYSAGRPAVPEIDFAAARGEIRAVIELVQQGLVNAAHDISDGGLAVCLGEMAMGLEAGDLRGAEVRLPGSLSDAGPLTDREILFGEAGGFVLTVSPMNLEAASALLDKAGVDWWTLGKVTNLECLTVRNARGDVVADLALGDMTRIWQTALPALLGGEEAADVVPGHARRSQGAQEGVFTIPAVNRDNRPRLAVVQLPGVNCEEESARLVNLAGGQAEIFRWTRRPEELAAFDGFLIPGGFSYQDRVRAGAVAAKDPLLRVLLEAAAKGKPILGICNGCQVLVEAGLVPGLEPGAVEVALAANRFPGRRGYHSTWVAVQAHPRARTPFVEGLDVPVPVPMAHAEGRFTHEDPAFFATLAEKGHVALQYTGLGGRAQTNPNGALLDVAGLTNVQGNVLAMMPHPERAAQLKLVPEDLPCAWGHRRAAAAGNVQLLEEDGPGAFLLRRLVQMC